MLHRAGTLGYLCFEHLAKGLGQVVSKSSTDPEGVNLEIDIEAELDRFRQKLLDLSNINRLLNYRKSSSRTVQIVDELPNQVFERLVLKEKPFSFLHKEEEDLPESEDLAASVMLLPNDASVVEKEVTHELPEHVDGSPVVRHHTDDKLQTEFTEKRLDRVLNTMRQEASAAVEETGVNYLYFALGMLEWREREGLERAFLAPLILLPVRLERSFDSRRNKYRTTVSYTGEDIQQNLCLAKRLENDFGLVLPEYQPDEDGNPTLPEDYFTAVSEAFKEKPDWRVRREGLIGFFSFRKLLMYLDLDPEKWQGDSSLNRHPLVRAVVEGAQISESSTFFAKDYEIDDYDTAKGISIVKDADSSQHSALCDIAEGKSLVIEGPPGTGKSQTITNAIADALSDGKTVLFVAEKLAALEVVRTNLEKVGLGSFCLELHSEAANPREVFADLGRRLDSHFPSSHELDALHARAEAQKKRLQLYLYACRLPAGPHGRPLYELFWRIVELRSRDVEVLTSAQLDTDIEELQFDDAIARLNEVAAHVKELGPPTERPWHGFFADQLPPSGQRQVTTVIEGLSGLASQMESIANALTERFEGKPDDWITLTKGTESNSLRAVIPPHGFDSSLVPFLGTIPACVTAKVVADEVRRVCEVRDRATDLVVGALNDAQVSAGRISNDLGKQLPKTLHAFPLEQLRELRSQATTAQHALTAFQRVATRLDQLGFGDVQTLRDFDQSCFKYRLVSHEAVAPPHCLSESLFYANAPAAFQRGKKTSARLTQLQEQIEERLHVSKAPDNDQIEELVDALQAYGDSWTRWFRKGYRRARKAISRCKRATAGRLKHTDWIESLRQLLSYRTETQKYTKDAELLRVFGDQFHGMDTDWTALEVALSWSNTAKKAGLGFQQANKLVRNRWEDDNAPPPGDVLGAGKVLRQELQQESICRALGLKAEVLDVSPLPKLQEHLTHLSTVLEQVEREHRSFAASDSVSFAELLDHAQTVLKAIAGVSDLQLNSEYIEVLPNHFKGAETEVDSLSTTCRWARSLLEMGIGAMALEKLSQDSTGEEARWLFGQLDELKRCLKQWTEHRDTLNQYGRLDEHWLSQPGPEGDACSIQRLMTLKEDAANLPPWAGLCRALNRCQSEGLGDFSQAIYEGRLRAEAAADSYDLTLHEQLADSILNESEPLRTFSRQGADRARTEFQQLDRQLIEAHQASIAHTASQRRVPAGISTGRVGQLTELGLIRHETGKQRRHCRIRDLVLRAGRAVQGLKPCFMMSPLSIAQFLPAGSLEFDLVVMDEASQIKPEDALGTLIRAKQLVVVGDPKQLPPTSFFDRISESDEDDESTFLDDTESILEVALKAFPHKRRLRWHYRSQHESLIAFSNEKFYDGDLVVFPSPTTAAGRLGLRWHHIEEASFTGGCNPIEANVIAASITRHVIECPDETLGVATFNAKQAQAIRDRLDELASNSSEVRLALERFHDHTDRLFVKNLENVQGDERDVIFISYTYGPDPATGVVMNRFGPMTGEHGWRRLNVLVTRAKRRVEVFSSMKPVDIKGGPERSRGVNAMKNYLQYAMTGQLFDRGAFTDREPDSPFEIAVARVIEGMGLRVVPQVGVAGYFVDIGVLVPESEGEFLLGVECDGATYHSSKSARDRDRLREEVITARGWRLHRIWSTDWFLNQEAEEERLREAISRELARHRHA